MTDLQAIQAVLNTGGIAIGLLVLWLVTRELLRMVQKMIDAQAELIQKLGEALMDNQQTYYRVRELIEEQRKRNDGRRNNE